jgi:hypothetical protein
MQEGKKGEEFGVRSLTIRFTFRFICGSLNNGVKRKGTAAAAALVSDKRRTTLLYG